VRNQVESYAVAPDFFQSNLYLCVTLMLFSVLPAILAFTFGISVVRDLDF